MEFRTIEHKGQKRYGLFFKYDSKNLDLIRKISGRKWSQTKSCWHIPYTENSLSIAKRYFDIAAPIEPPCTQPDVETLPNASKQHLGAAPASLEHKTSKNPKGLIIRWQKNYFSISFDYDKHFVGFLKSLDDSVWMPHYKVWNVKATLSNLKILQQKTGYWSTEKIGHLEASIQRRTYISPSLKSTTQEFVSIALPYKKEWIEIIKHLPKRRYDKENKLWFVPNEQAILERLVFELKEAGLQMERKGNLYIQKSTEAHKHTYYQYGLLEKVTDSQREILKRYSDKLIQMRYSKSSFKVYTSFFIRFLDAVGLENLNRMNKAEIETLVSDFAKTNVSRASINQYINAIKFYYEKVLGRAIERYAIHRPRKVTKLPQVLSSKEVERLFSETENLKHLAMLYLAYSCGLRISEVVALKVHNIDSDRMVLRIENSKGNKDREIPLSEIVLKLLREYYKAYRPTDYLFEGQQNGMRYSSSSLRKVYNRCKSKARIYKHATFHSLRHSFATHQLERGVDVRIIQALLGHGSLKTTMRYTHVSKKTIENVKSPIDFLNLEKSGTINLKSPYIN